MVLTHKDTPQSKNHRAFSSLCLNPWRFFWCLRICRKVHEFVLLLCNMTGFQRTAWKMSEEPSLVLFDFPKQIQQTRCEWNMVYLICFWYRYVFIEYSDQTIRHILPVHYYFINTIFTTSGVLSPLRATCGLCTTQALYFLLKSGQA